MANNKKYLVLSITLVLLTFIGVSLAYFLTSIEGENKRVTISTSDLRIIFTNGDAIEGTEIEPGWSVTKTFSVENKTKNEYKYNIVIEDLVNTFKTTGYLQYKITSTDGGYNMTSFEDVPKSSSALDTDLVNNVVIPAKSKQNYTITIQYPNDENVNQSIDSLNNAVLSGKLYITEGTTNSRLLTQAILEDNPTVETRTIFSTAFTEKTTGTIFQTDKTEDGSTVYYYAGDTTNNWVKFGYYNLDDYSDSSDTSIKNYFNKKDYMYWRIIRTNEDGSIRLLYAGNSPESLSPYIPGLQEIDSTIALTDNDFYHEAIYNEIENDPLSVGYMYGTSGSLENNRTNENSSTMKKSIDIWYLSTMYTSIKYDPNNNQQNNKNYNDFVSVTALYCNDRSLSSSEIYSTSEIFSYASGTRTADHTPTYKCGGDGNGGLFESTQSVADKFSASTEGGGNGQLKCFENEKYYCPVALMTVDETMFAGAELNTAANNDIYINKNKSALIGTSYWTMTPNDFYDGGNVYNIIFSASGYEQLWSEKTISQSFIRPVLSLKSCVKVTGTGTPDDPYVVDYDNSCS